MSRKIFILGFLFGITPLTVADFKFSSLSKNTLQPNQVITFNWTPSNGGKVDLRLQSQDADYSDTIIKGTTNIGAYTWTVPSDIPSDSHYVINISDSSDSTNTGTSDSFSVQGSSFSVTTRASSTSTSSASSTSTSSAASTSTSASTTFTTSTSSVGDTPATTQSSTSTTSLPPSPQTSATTSAISSSTGVTTPNTSNGGLSTSARNAIIISLILAAALAGFAALFWLFLRRRRRSKASEIPADDGTLNAEKRYTDDGKGYMYSPTLSQGVRSSQATQNTELWHYKPELPGSDPTRESGIQFLAPVELPAWEPSEIDPLTHVSNEEQHGVHVNDIHESTSRPNEGPEA
ncbi:hypothetical protein BGW36DRAFT_138958 [Talaromyces proteolyticus]|uniref:Yeast cell wall synthesis Kre9/Knh1-like N-terminal domain-containing protein n=1 Tax=Talaromyces proteolyticus TaxID=1131652 RepID=A0AAD4KVY1_9EURO|nr:uncharacterized protein BGW36DRAFT_138958 [Talaromyces proteolyticus]KAH8700981.1 hypothetical protein BGW36DRAFT_138958 [Talaromyces proteolyticus]